MKALDSGKKTLGSWWPAALVFVTAFLFRIWYAAEPSLYLDEAASAFHAQMDWAGFLDFLSRDANPPLYYLLLRGWIGMFGISPMAIRSLSVLFSSLAAAGIYLLARRYLNRRTAIAASLFFLLSNPNIHYAQEARCFALVGLLATASCYGFLAWQESGHRKWLWLLAISNILLMYTHYAAVPLLLMQGAVSLLFWPGWANWRGFLWAQLASLLALAPVFFMLTEDKWGSTGKWLPSPGMPQFIRTVDGLSGGVEMAWAFAILIFTGGVLAFWKRERPRKPFKKWMVLFCFSVGSLLLAALISQWVPIFLLKYQLYTSIGLFLLLGFSLSRIPGFWSYVAIAVVAGGMVWTVNPFQNKNEDWKEAAQVAAQFRGPNSVVILTPGYQLKTFAYYFDRSSWDQPHELIQTMYKQNVFATDKLEADFFRYQKQDSFLLIQSHIDVTDPKHESLEILEERFESIGWGELAGIEWSLFKKPEE